MTRIDEKLEKFTFYLMRGIYAQVQQYDNEEACIYYRKAAEAYMKICIFAFYGEEDGQDIIMGRKDAGRQPTGREYHLAYQELRKLLNIMTSYGHKYITLHQWEELERLGELVSASAHDSDDDEEADTDCSQTQAEEALRLMEPLMREAYRLALEGESLPAAASGLL